MRFVWFRNLIAVLVVTCGLASAQGINPGLDIAWPSNCSTSSTWAYNYASGLCFDVAALAGGITQLTGDVSTGAPGSGSKAATLASVGSPGTYGDSTHVPQITTDTKGRLTGTTAVAIAYPTLAGDVSGPPGSTVLATVNSSPGTCGDATHVCQITVNAKGLTPSQTAIAIRPPLANVQIAMPTSAIAANTCTTLTNTTMTGLLTTSTFTTAFASDPTGATGWGMNGGLIFVAWPTANTAVWKVCNQSNASITPGAISINLGANP